MNKDISEILIELVRAYKRDPILSTKLLVELTKNNILLPAEKKLRGFNKNIINMALPFFQFLFTKYFRVEVTGINNIPKKGAAMIVANHSGCVPYDASMIYMAVHNHLRSRREVRFLVDDFAYKIPFLRTLLERVGAIPANRENANKLLDHKELLCIFPEGVEGIGKIFLDRYKLQDFSWGCVRLSIKNNVPIIPCSVVGAEEVHPILWKSEKWGKILGLPFLPLTLTFPWLGPLGLIPLPTKWKIIFGKPIHYKFPPKRVTNGRLVKKMTFELQTKIQMMIENQLKKRKSIWE